MDDHHINDQEMIRNAKHIDILEMKMWNVLPSVVSLRTKGSCAADTTFLNWRDLIHFGQTRD
jgi:hypothetical protein